MERIIWIKTRFGLQKWACRYINDKLYNQSITSTATYFFRKRITCTTQMDNTKLFNKNLIHWSTQQYTKIRQNRQNTYPTNCWNISILWKSSRQYNNDSNKWYITIINLTYYLYWSWLYILLDYLATNLNAKILFYASLMILHVNTDAAYLVASKARSRIAGYFYMSDNYHPKTIQHPKNNGSVQIECHLLRHMVSSVAEAETAALFFNTKIAIDTRRML